MGILPGPRSKDNDIAAGNVSISSMSIASQARRFPLVDLHRGFAVILMIIYHSFYDLTMISALPYHFMFTTPMVALQRITMNSFIFCVGVSMALAHQREFRYKAFMKRELQLLACAALVSLATYIAFPPNWVFFGILHFMALASILILPFARLPWLALPIALALLVPYFGWGYALPWFKLNPMPFDYVPLFPWLGFAFLGIFAYRIGWHRLVSKEDALPWLQFLGRHSLLIYLLHQPLLLGIFYLSAPLWRSALAP